MRTLLLSSTLSLIAFGLSASPGQAACKHEVTQTHSFTEGLLCSYWTYCFSLRVPANCTLPVSKLCIQFRAGTNQLSSGSLSSPPGWTGTINQANNEVCWTAVQRSKQVQPGQTLGGFCIQTVCNPQRVEGIQNWSTGHPKGISGQEGQCLFSKSVAKLFGQAQVRPGQFARLASLDPHPMLPSAPLFLSLGQAKIPAGPLGTLHLDPSTLFLMGRMQSDPMGQAQRQIPIPPDPRLSGLALHFQLLDIDFSRMRLSNPWRIQIR